MSFPKPEPKKRPHKWDARGQCAKCKLVKSAQVGKLGCKPKHKFGAVRTVIDGESFPSRLEAQVWSMHRAREIRGEIENLTRKATVRFPGLGISYQADMKYEVRCQVVTKVDMKKATITVGNSPNQTIWVEAKGKEGDRWRIVKKLWKACGPGDLMVYKMKDGGLYLAQIIQGGNDSDGVTNRSKSPINFTYGR